MVRLSQQAKVSSRDQGANSSEASTATDPEEKEVKPPTDDHLKVIAGLQNEKQTLMDTVKSVEVSAQNLLENFYVVIKIPRILG